MDSGKELIIITGTDSGIGKSLLKLFIHHGYTVCAAFLEKPGADTSINIKVDVRNESDIVTLVQKISNHVNEGHRCRCLILNAGIALGGPIENLPLSYYRECFEVNVTSYISIIQKLIPYLAKSKGTVMIQGSTAARVAIPFISPYIAAKSALEGLTDCLRRELTPYGIKTILLQTGIVDTPIWKKAEKQDISFLDKKYRKSYRKSMELIKKNFIKGKKGLTADEAAKKIFRVFKKKKPKPRYIIAKNIFYESLIRILPHWFLDKLLLKMFDMDYGDQE